MSSFFRDSSLGFKPRANIFNKFKSKENGSAKSPHPEFNNTPGNLSLTDDDSDSSITNTLMLVSNNSNLTDHTTQQTSDTSIVQSNGKNSFNSSSTPRNNKNTIKNINEQNKPHSEGTYDDDFEITEVRHVEEHDSKPFLPSNNNYTTDVEIPVRHNSIVDSMKEDDSSNSSSNDVLLIAFTNTQKICSNLKQELQSQHTENTKLKIKLNTYETDIGKITTKVETFKKLLADLEGKGKRLLSQKQNDDDKLNVLSKEYEISKQKINGYREDIMSLRALLNKIQDSRRDIEVELTKKAKEVEYLKRELDDCSGQLSEEKIRNGTLSHELETFKNEIIMQLKDISRITQEDIISSLQQNKNEMCDDLSESFKTKLQQDSTLLLENFSQIALTLTEKIETSTESVLNITKGCESTTINEFTSLINLSNSIKQDLLNNYENGRKIILDEISTGKEASMKVFDTASNEIAQKFEYFTNQLQTLESQIEQYQQNLVQSKEHEEIAKDLEKEICTLQQQVNENMAIIGAKEAQYEEKSAKVNEQAIELAKFKDGHNELASIIKENKLKIEKCEQELAHYKNLLETEKANFENKFMSQNEINTAVISENDILKKRVKELESYKTNWENDQDNKLDKFQKINDQFQRLNVESIQLKAHELELEEENRYLKRTIEANEENCEDNAKELDNLKKQLLLNATERQGLTAERLTLQDENDELQSIIKKLRKEAVSFKAKVEKLETEKKSNDEILFEDNDDLKENGSQLQKGDFFFPQTQVPSTRVMTNVVKPNKATKSTLERKSKVEKNKVIEKPEKRKPSEDEFDLSSNDDLELTNSSPLYVRPLNPKIKASGKMDNRKKLLLVDDFDMDGVSIKRNNPSKKRKK